MSWFVLMEMSLVAMMTIYLTYHTHLIFVKARHRKIITTIIIICFIGLCLNNLIFFGFLANACICFILFDIINLLLYKTKFNHYFKFIYQRGMVALAASVILSFYGMYNAKNTIITTYDVNINKPFADKRLLVVGDIHLGTAVSNTDLTKIVNHASTVNPDGIVLLGDIYDEGTTQEQFDYSLQVFGNLAKHYPVYYVEGNHEIGFQGGSPLKEFEIVKNLRASGVTVLLDEVVKLDDLYIIGRKDYVVKKRASLASLINDLDTSKPMILLDHQPHEYALNEQLGIDLELSGHSHGGQIFPLNYLYEITKVNDLNYGMITNNNFNAIVTSGMGGWGYAMRTVKHSEIVVVNIKSKIEIAIDKLAPEIIETTNDFPD